MMHCWLVLVFSFLIRLHACQAFLISTSSKGSRYQSAASNSESLSLSNDAAKNGGVTEIYFDLEVTGQPIGRLSFRLAHPFPLPQHTDNLIQLCRGDRRSIDPLAHYVGCTFDYGPDYIEDGSGRYRWGHILRGRGRNAVGRPDEAIPADPETLRQCTHACFGGQYYGMAYNEDDDTPGVLLTVPVTGPGRGSSRFSIVRVGESPPEWRERLLLNSGVVGTLVSESLETLHIMARQRAGPPTVVVAGVNE